MILLAAIATLFHLACASKSNPVAASFSPHRSASDFRPSWILFNDPPMAYNEIDLAPLLNGWKPGGYADLWYGEPAEITVGPSETRKYCIAITAEHAPEEDRIIYAWLDDSVDCINGGPPVATGCLFHGGDTYEIASPKAAAIYYFSYEGPQLCVIEVTVAFMCRDKEFPNARWNIRAISAFWFESNFPSGNPMTASNHVFGDGTPHDVDNSDDWAPDVEYDYQTGEPHLVWTTWTDFYRDRARVLPEHTASSLL